jgi:Flp pilus assembly pilin Flp
MPMDEVTRRGQGLLEYAVIIVIIAIFLMAFLMVTGDGITNLFEYIMTYF